MVPLQRKPLKLTFFDFTFFSNGRLTRSVFIPLKKNITLASNGWYKHKNAGIR